MKRPNITLKACSHRVSCINSKWKLCSLTTATPVCLWLRGMRNGGGGFEGEVAEPLWGDAATISISLRLLSHGKVTFCWQVYLMRIFFSPEMINKTNICLQSEVRRPLRIIDRDWTLMLTLCQHLWGEEVVGWSLWCAWSKLNLCEGWICQIFPRVPLPADNIGRTVST